MTATRKITDIRKTLPFSGYVLAACTAAALGGLLYGFTLSVVAGAETAITGRFGLGNLERGLVVGNLDLGAAAGALAAGLLGDRLGRKRVILSIAVLYLGSGVLTAFAPSLPVILLGRLMAGLAVGASLILPLFIAEISPPRWRGFLVGFVQVAIVIGILSAYTVSLLLMDSGASGWRWMFGAGVPVAIVFLASAAFLPESPRWLVTRGRTAEALAVLARTEGGDRAEEALRGIGEAVHSQVRGWRELFRPANRRALKVGLLVSVTSVAVGINAVILYGPSILMQGGRDLREALVGSIVLGAVNLAATLAALPWIDRIGRKPLLLAGLAGTALAMAALGFSFRPGTSESASGSVWALASILAFVAFYAVSLGPITWILIAEIFPTNISGAAMAVALVAMYIADFAVTFGFPSLMSWMGGDGFFCFTAVSVVAAVLVAHYVPETKGRSLEHVHSSWDLKRSGRISRSETRP